ncbi:hypothetical protein WJX77_012485 [Trebouxia sp. C0004]
MQSLPTQDACLHAWNFKPVVMMMVFLQVRSESTGHAETVQKMHDPQQAWYGKLVDLLYSMHNSTTPNRADDDIGTLYTSYTATQRAAANTGYPKQTGVVHQ